MKRFFILLIALCSAVTFWACEDLLSNLLPQKPDNDEQVDGSNDPDNDDEEGGNEGGNEGGFSEWSNDTYMTYDAERNCYYAEVVMSPTYENFDNGFKLRYAADWGNNRGSVDMLTELPLNCDIPVCHDGYNLPLELAGRYLVEYYYTTETMRVEYLGAMQ